MKENLEIKVVNEDGKPIEMIIREGEAANINEPVKFSLAVAMKSINEWLNKRTYDDDPKKNSGVIVFCKNPARPSLSFDDNPNDSLATSLTSKLTINPDLVAFAINKDQFFSNKDLAKLVRKFAHCFADIEDVKTLMKSLQNFEVKYEQTVIKEDNRQGQTKDLVEAAIKVSKGEIPTQFKLKLPLFLSTPPVDITLEIEIEKIQGTNMPGFGFYSLDLEPLIRTTIDEVIDGEVNVNRSKFVCLELD